MKYLGVKLVEGLVMNLGEYNKLRGWEIPADEDPAKEGYLVQYPDGYKSWCPKEQFERANMPLQSGEENTVCIDDVERFISEIHVETLGEKTTCVRVVLQNGFEIVECSSCVDPANYNEVMGKNICLDRIKDKIWELLGFVLQTGVHGLK